MAGWAQSDEVLSVAFHLDMIYVGYRQCATMCVKFFTRKTTLLTAFFALPAGSLFDCGGDLVPILGILSSIHWHDRSLRL